MMAAQVPGMISAALLAAGTWDWEEAMLYAGLCDLKIV